MVYYRTHSTTTDFVISVVPISTDLGISSPVMKSCLQANACLYSKLSKPWFLLLQLILLGFKKQTTSISSNASCGAWALCGALKKAFHGQSGFCLCAASSEWFTAHTVTVGRCISSVAMRPISASGSQMHWPWNPFIHGALSTSYRSPAEAEVSSPYADWTTKTKLAHWFQDHTSNSYHCM